MSAPLVSLPPMARLTIMRQIAPQPARLERRRKPRIDLPFPVQVSGRDHRGEAFEVQTSLRNLSASGLYMEMSRELERGGRLSLVIQMARSGQQEEAATVKAEAEVVRLQRLEEERWGVGMRLLSRRVI